MLEVWKKVTVNKPWVVIAGAATLIVLLGWYGLGLFGEIKTSDQFTANGTESMRAKDAVESVFGTTPTNDIILFERKDATLGAADSPAYQAEVVRLLRPLRNDVKDITTFADAPTPAFISKDKTMTYAAIEGKGSEAEIYNVLQEFKKTADTSRLDVPIGGASVISQQMNETVSRDLARTELITFPILLLLLILFFRSAVAALVPLVISIITIAGAFAVARLVNHVVAIDQYAVNVITILGIGLAIDYALLCVNRFREELRSRKSVGQAVRTVIDTSGRTVFFSAITVIACMLSLLVFPLDFMHSIAIGGSSAVLVAMLFTVLVLPAVLMVIGTKIDAWHLPGKKQGITRSPFWTRVAHLTTKHPLAAATGALAVIALAWLPLSHFVLSGTMDYRYIAEGSSGRYVMQKMQEDFSVQSPGVSAIVTFDDGVSRSDQIASVCQLTRDIQAQPNVVSVISATMLPEGMSCAMYGSLHQNRMLPTQLSSLFTENAKDNNYRFNITLGTQSGTQESADTLVALRDLTPERAEWLVGGMEGYAYDTNHAYLQMIPVALGIIALSMVILLTLLLASVVLPLQAILVNSLSLAISFAVLVGVFQLGWLDSLTGWGTTEGIVMTPLILIATIAFGLAMDYSVFLYSRMFEVYEKTGNHIRAVQEGIIKTGPIISAAALMVFVVVVAFAGSSVVLMQMIGLGLGVAVLVDAFFVRLLLVPSIMTLMGKASWYAPKWIKRLRIKHE